MRTVMLPKMYRMSPMVRESHGSPTVGRIHPSLQLSPLYVLLALVSFVPRFDLVLFSTLVVASIHV